MGEYISIEQLTQHLNVSRTAISNWRRRAEFGFPEPDVEIGVHPGWRVETIDEWWSRHRARLQPKGAFVDELSEWIQSARLKWPDEDGHVPSDVLDDLTDFVALHRG